MVLWIVTYDLKADESPTYGGDCVNKDKYYPWSYISGTITLNMRESVMADPLDYYPSKSGSKTMNNITVIDLEYNFNNHTNMILFNQATLLSMSKGVKPLEDIKINFKTINKDEEDWWNELLSEFLESYMNVEITDATLEIDVATPQITSSMLL